MYAIIETGSKQYKVEQGDVVFVDRLQAQEGEEIAFDTLMLSDEDGVKVGTPKLDMQVKAKVLGHGKSSKILVFKYKAKKNYRRLQGHRQPFTKVEILSIGE
ncbi:MAG: 50S ribosomal protein L21 [Christensenellales bacterium]|jgi:large subunit ribosomal protein L21